MKSEFKKILDGEIEKLKQTPRTTKVYTIEACDLTGNIRDLLYFQSAVLRNQALDMIKDEPEICRDYLWLAPREHYICHSNYDISDRLHKLGVFEERKKEYYM